VIKRVFELIRAERDKQDKKWGANAIRTVGPDSRMCILAEEVGEAAEVVNRMRDEGVDLTSELRKELIQVAAVAVAWLEKIEFDCIPYCPICGVILDGPIPCSHCWAICGYCPTCCSILSKEKKQ